MGLDEVVRIDSFFFTVDNYVQKVFLKHKLDHRKHQEATKVTLCNDSLKSLTKEILSKAANVRKCDNCGGKSPGLRKESNSRIFEQPLKARDRDIMNAQGISTFRSYAGLVGDQNSARFFNLDFFHTVCCGALEC